MAPRLIVSVHRGWRLMGHNRVTCRKIITQAPIGKPFEVSDQWSGVNVRPVADRMTVAADRFAVAAELRRLRYARCF